ncbi:MAG: pyridoxamine 5'-phosphate oxidase family protein [Gammaproteobacteria bacterium]|nr:pyridoxamine 5'-phosphate oxidase family protein [Gammaproteobacteria bacterium]
MTKNYHQEAERFIQSRKYLTMATAAADGQAFAHTVGYASEAAVLYFATDKNTQKITNISSNPKVGYTIDMDEDAPWLTLEGLQMVGKAEVVQDKAEMQKAHALLLDKFPQLKEFEQNEEMMQNMVIVKITPIKGRFLDNSVHFGYSADLAY